VVSKLKLPHFVARTKEGKESNCNVWASLANHLITTLEKQNDGGKISLLGHLPEECGVVELSWLNSVLPPSYRVTEQELLAHYGDVEGDGDGDGDGVEKMGSLVDDAMATNKGNATVKIQIFSSLLRSLILSLSPFVFVIEDLHWMDAGSWQLLLLASSSWSHGLMLVCTTRPGMPPPSLPPPLPPAPLPPLHPSAPQRCVRLH
jgi:hypothetical protein